MGEVAKKNEHLTGKKTFKIEKGAGENNWRGEVGERGEERREEERGREGGGGEVVY